MNTIFLRHYIFIDPNDIFSNNNENVVLNEIKEIHKKNYLNGEIIKYYNYNDIIILLDNYDKELCDLFKKINTNYPALLSDIGRLIILYNYGGVYHDLKFMSNNKMISYLNTVLPEIEVICDEHPFHKNRVRIGNIIALQIKSKFLNMILQKIKEKLLQPNNYYGPQDMFNISSGTYIIEFENYQDKNVYKYPLQNMEMLFYDNDIYFKNIKKWQNTKEYIFTKN